MTKIPCQYMIKTLKNLFLQNQKSYDLETWHVVLGLKCYKIYVNDDSELTMTYFMAMSDLVLIAFQ